MPEEDEFNRFLPEENLDKDKLSTSIPPQQHVPPDRIPSGYDPMGRIHLQGQAHRSMATGQVPGWVLITGWIVFGGTALILAYVAIISPFVTTWVALAISLIPLFVLWRGTRARTANRRHRR